MPTDLATENAKEIIREGTEWAGDFGSMRLRWTFICWF